MTIQQTTFNELVSTEKSEDTLKTIFCHLANGGSLVDLCQSWNVRYSDVVYWMNGTEERKKALNAAIEAQQEWVKTSLLRELKQISFVDITKILNREGGLIDPASWPPEIARVIESIEIKENFADNGDGQEQVGWTKKVKLASKLKAIEMMMKNLGMLTERVEHSGKVTLEELVAGSK
jgi:hypothetical protein